MSIDASMQIKKRYFIHFIRAAARQCFSAMLRSYMLWIAVAATALPGCASSSSPFYYAELPPSPSMTYTQQEREAVYQKFHLTRLDNGKWQRADGEYSAAQLKHAFEAFPKADKQYSAAVQRMTSGVVLVSLGAGLAGFTPVWNYGVVSRGDRWSDEAIGVSLGIAGGLIIGGLVLVIVSGSPLGRIAPIYNEELREHLELPPIPQPENPAGATTAPRNAVQSGNP